MERKKSNHNLTLVKKITSGIVRAAVALMLVLCVGCSKNKDVYHQGNEAEVAENDSGAGGSETTSNEGSGYEEDLRACCRIYTKSQCSSGFIVYLDRERVVIAASLHGLSDWGEGSEVVFFDGSSAFGQVFGSKEELDVGFIEVAAADIGESIYAWLVCAEGTKEKPGDENLNETTDSGSDEAVNITRRIHAYDLFPEGSSKNDPRSVKYVGELISEDEYLYDYDRTMLFGKLERVNDGMSGTPVFSDEGKCLGMIVAGNDDGQFAGIFYDEIMKLLYFP